MLLPIGAQRDRAAFPACVNGGHPHAPQCKRLVNIHVLIVYSTLHLNHISILGRIDGILDAGITCGTDMTAACEVVNISITISTKENSILLFIINYYFLKYSYKIFCNLYVSCRVLKAWHFMHFKTAWSKTEETKFGSSRGVNFRFVSLRST